MLVGGSVRDLLLGLDSKDIDLEVYGLSPERLRDVLEVIGTVNTVGEQFAVYKLSIRRPGAKGKRFSKGEVTSDVREPRVGIGEQAGTAEREAVAAHGTVTTGREIDVSIPRRESKSGTGHRGFLITGDPSMTFEEAAQRRDFTVNAILMDPLTGETVDPTGGVEDLTHRVLRAVSAGTFVEDSLRVLRAMQFAARFEMTIEPSTVQLCRSIDLTDLPHERVWGEFEKLLLAARKPSIGLQAARDLLILDKLFPAIRALAGCPRDRGIRGGIDAFAHTQLALDSAALLCEPLPRTKKLTLMLAVLLHDVGRPVMLALAEGPFAGSEASRSESGQTQVPGDKHDQAGVGPATTVLDRFGVFTLDNYDVRSQVLALVREHLRPRQFYRHRYTTTNGDFRRLSRRVDLSLLYLVAKADEMTLEKNSSAGAADWFIARAREIGVEHGPPAALLQGRHLIEMGYDPGPKMGRILRDVYELQLDGKVTTLEEAIAAARSSPD